MRGAEMSASSGEFRPPIAIYGGVIALLLILGGMIGACGGIVPPQGSTSSATATAQAQTSSTAQARANTATAQAQLNATATVQAQASATAQAQTATATAAPRVTITFPTEGSKVSVAIIVQGTASN